MGTQLASYRNEIYRLHGQSDDLCVAVSALLGYITRMRAAHAEEMCANAGTGECSRCASYVETIARLMAGTEASPQETTDGPCDGDGHALKWTMETIHELHEKIGRLESTVSNKNEEIEWLTKELANVKNELKGWNRHLKRYENSTTSGRHGYNEVRAYTAWQKFVAKPHPFHGSERPTPRYIAASGSVDGGGMGSWITSV